jgi:transcriptional regulator with XRE-family HTH domain
MEMFTQRLIGGRNRKGLTQTELAKELGVHLRSIQNWEGGLTEPRGKVLRNLSEVLGMSVAFLLGMDEQAGVGKSARFVKDSKGGETRQKAHEYLDKVLDACRGDEDREAWTYIELKKKFPLASSAVDAAAEEILSGAGGSGSRRGRGSSRSRGAGGPSARTSGPARGAGRLSSKRP